jgi:hypothetical protein
VYKTLGFEKQLAEGHLEAIDTRAAQLSKTAYVEHAKA